MSSTSPDHHDAELMIKVYDLRREPSMREARNAINGQFWPTSFADIQAVFQLGHPMNVAWRQTSTYWEMVYAMARHGIVHPEYWAEGNGEGLLLFAKIEPFLQQIRRELSPVAFRHTEWMATQTVEGRRIVQVFRERIDKTMQARKTQ